MTPVCATSIATGVLQDRHHIAAMNWWSRAERRYVEYGSSFRAARKLGIAQQLTDTVYNLNGSPPRRRRRDDLRVARRRRRADGGDDLPGLSRAPRAPDLARDRADAACRHALPQAGDGPARALLRRHLRQPRHRLPQPDGPAGDPRPALAGCVGAWLAARDLYDFLLLSLPDNDTHSHKNGPHAQPTSIAAADAQILRVAEAAGGPTRFLDTHAVIICADHSHAAVERRIDLRDAFARLGRRRAGRDRVRRTPRSRCAPTSARP